jgi:hypothetical protein
VSTRSAARPAGIDALHAMWTSPEARFTCSGFHFDAVSGLAHLGYRLSGAGEVLEFTETVRVPLSGPLDAERAALLDDVLALLHAVAGVSYYKGVAPPTVDLGGHAFTPAELEFVAGVYRNGMREFAYVNDLPSALEPELVHTAPAPAVASRAPESASRPLVPCGGGKDSIVTLEALLRSGRRPISFAVNPKQWITDVMATAGTDAVTAQRTIDPLLLELNAAGARNGHVPVTAINSLIAVATALAVGAGPVVMSNESSASIPNLTWHGVEVNHQWAKSLEAERLLAAALASRAVPVGYFSLLRHLNEVQIAELFAHVSGYDASMTSCNRAFTMDAAAGTRWCRNCPKCRFVFLVLAPFVERARLLAIFGGDVLDDPAQVDGYRRLLGIDGARPFECVGDVDESLALLRRVSEDPQWSGTAVVRALSPSLAGVPTPAWSEVLQRRADSLAPAGWRETLDALG